MWKLLLFGTLAVVVAGLIVAHGLYRSALAEAERAMEELAARNRSVPTRFDPATVTELPEIARRYFRHAIKPGTLLSTTVRLEMEGTFLLGDARQHQAYAMTARQLLAPPSEFVWIPSLRSGPMQIGGSDALVSGIGWTRFWINGLVPVVNQGTSPDLVRSALTRSAMEGVWAPASLLPGNGVIWTQTGPNTARLAFGTGVEPVDLTLDDTGRILAMTTMRWSNENADKAFRLQPFGGTVEAEATFGGFTIPSRLSMGNHYGTADYLPFFQATITSAEYLPGHAD